MRFADLADISWETVSALSAIAIAIMGYLVGRAIRKRSNRVDQYNHLVEYRREIIDFSQRFSELVSDALAVMTTASTEDRDSKLIGISCRISGHVDLGRMYFPNDIQAPNDFGSEKGRAYAGRRRPALDAMLAAHLAIEAETSESAARRDQKLAEAIKVLRRANQPLVGHVGLETPRAVLVQARRTYFNEVAPEVFPRKWYSEFKSLLGPVTDGRDDTGAAPRLLRSYAADRMASSIVRRR